MSATTSSTTRQSQSPRSRRAGTPAPSQRKRSRKEDEDPSEEELEEEEEERIDFEIQKNLIARANERISREREARASGKEAGSRLKQHPPTTSTSVKYPEPPPDLTEGRDEDVEGPFISSLVYTPQPPQLPPPPTTTSSSFPEGEGAVTARIELLQQQLLDKTQEIVLLQAQVQLLQLESAKLRAEKAEALLACEQRSTDVKVLESQLAATQKSLNEFQARYFSLVDKVTGPRTP